MKLIDKIKEEKARKTVEFGVNNRKIEPKYLICSSKIRDKAIQEMVADFLDGNYNESDKKFLDSLMPDSDKVETESVCGLKVAIISVCDKDFWEII